MIKAISITTDGAVTGMELADFDAIRTAVGGWVEIITSRDGRVVFWCNEDGRPLGLNPNGLATALWWRVDQAAQRDIRLVGPVIVTGAMGDDDSIADVPGDVAELMAAYQK